MKLRIVVFYFPYNEAFNSTDTATPPPQSPQCYITIFYSNPEWTYQTMAQDRTIFVMWGEIICLQFATTLLDVIKSFLLDLLSCVTVRKPVNCTIKQSTFLQIVKCEVYHTAFFVFILKCCLMTNRSSAFCITVILLWRKLSGLYLLFWLTRSSLLPMQ